MNYQTTWNRIKSASLKIDHAKKKETIEVELPKRGSLKWVNGNAKWEFDPNGQFLLHSAGLVEVLSSSEMATQEQRPRRGFLSGSMGKVAKGLRGMWNKFAKLFPDVHSSSVDKKGLS